MTEIPISNDQYTEEPFAHGPSRTADFFLGVTCLFCFLVGVPSNLVSLRYFIQTRIRTSSTSSVQRFFGYLYIFITITDCAICFTIFPLIEAFMNKRKSVMFDNRTFCAIWAVLWEILPFYSVFLVGVLSISRLITLTKPYKTLNISILLGFLIGYLAFLVLSKAIPLMLSWSTYIYLQNTMYCFLLEKEPLYLPLSIVSSTVLLAAPILPIMASCIYTVYRLQTQQVAAQSRTARLSTRKSMEATKTVIIVTVVYILYNIPVFMKYIHHLVFVVTAPLSDYKQYYSTTVLYYYGWVLTYVMCVVLNSATNPLIYFQRMTTFRRYVTNKPNMITEAGTLAKSVKISDP